MSKRKQDMTATNGVGEGARDLATLFSPRSIAVVGATTNAAAIGGQPLKHLADHGYEGTIYPVNPKYADIAGLRCYPDLVSLPETPDLVVVAVSAHLVPDVIRVAGQKGVPFALVFSSGFAEVGGDGKDAQSRLQAVAESAGVTLIGPNCQGLINISDDIPVGFGAPYGLTYSAGAVSLTSQSGAFGNSLLMALNKEGVGLRHYVSTGNEAATSTLDFFSHFIDDPQTHVVAAYVEGFRDARSLRVIAGRALLKRKPIIVWKVGNTVEGANAASSHTANLAGGSTYYRAAFRQFGIIAVNDIADMADCARALLTGRLPFAGRGVAILSISGGAGIAMTDRCIELGLDVVRFGDDTSRRLKTLMPDFGSAGNPVDMTAAAMTSPEAFGAALRSILEDPAVHMLGLCLAALSGQAAVVVALEIVTVAAEYSAPILVAWNAPHDLNGEAYGVLAEAGIPVYDSPVRSARGLSALAEYAAAVKRYDAAPFDSSAQGSPDDVDLPVQTLNEFDSKQLLARHGVPISREAVAHDREQAVGLAEELGYPVVLKILSADLPHKSDMGGVRINIADADAVRLAYDAILQAVEQFDLPIQVDGVLVQEMASAGTEVILGAVNDPAFGPAIMFGAGGIFAEILEDVAFKIAPLSADDARDLIAQTRVARLLEGVRGQPPRDVEALVECILRLSDFVIAESHRFAEVDINPLIVSSHGHGVKIVDALIKLRQI
ncbi:acetate--CoA ligase family protein [Salinisphaera aquimarina]|uniref:Acetate--CoA ligase family protein n=1 Tax=Salinisphaera aquimarina TaxID=2094031 RepID=A0ABV7EUF1_9GAMM